jgi:hypothetical protein
MFTFISNTMKQKEETFNITGAPIQSLGLRQKIASLTSTGPYKNLTDFLKVGPSISKNLDVFSLARVLSMNFG